MSAPTPESETERLLSENTTLRLLLMQLCGAGEALVMTLYIHDPVAAQEAVQHWTALMESDAFDSELRKSVVSRSAS